MNATAARARGLSAPLRALRTALSTDLALGRRLVSNAEAQQRALISHDFRQLAELAEAGQLILDEQRENVGRREDALRRLTHALDDDHDELSDLPGLMQIAERLEPADGAALLEIRDRILEVREALEAVNTQNRALVMTGLDFINFTFSTLAEMAGRPAGYGAANVRPQTPTFYLDHQA